MPIEHNYSELVPFRACGDRPPLFCIHDGEGQLVCYQDMVAALHDDQPVYGLRPVNLDGARAFLTVEQLAAVYLSDIRKIQKRGPYRLLGYSLGSLIAYEIATLLLSKGESVCLLALVETPHPKLQRNLTRTELKQFRITYFVNRIKKYTRNLFGGRIDHAAADAIKYVGIRMTRRAWKIARKVCVLLNCPMPNILRSNIIMFDMVWHAYTPKPYKNSIILFRSGERTPEYSDRTLGWSKSVCGQIDVHFVAGGHVTIMQAPNVLPLADRLMTYLAKCEDSQQ